MIVHVDDLLIADNAEGLRSKVFDRLRNKFELKELGNVRHYLGIKIEREEDGSIFMSQSSYFDEIVDVAGQRESRTSTYPLDPGYYKNEDDEPITNQDEYQKLIGMLLYLATNTRPDIAASVSILSQRVSKPARSRAV